MADESRRAYVREVWDRLRDSADEAEVQAMVLERDPGSTEQEKVIATLARCYADLLGGLTDVAMGADGDARSKAMLRLLRTMRAAEAGLAGVERALCPGCENKLHEHQAAAPEAAP